MLIKNNKNLFLFLLNYLILLLKCDDTELQPMTTNANQQLLDKTNQPVKSNNEKIKLTIAIMLPQDFIRLRNFHVCINREIVKINKANWSFTKHFYLDRFLFLIFNS